MSETPVLKKKYPWRNRKDAFDESLRYLRGRMNGTISSVKTPWPKFDDAGVDGLEWNSTVIIGGRPGSGKTAIKDQFIRESFKLNPGENFRVLEFQFEMLGRVAAIRYFSSILGITYTEACTKITPEQLALCKKLADEILKYPVDIVEEPCTVNTLISIINQYMEVNSYIEKVRVPVLDEKGKKKLDEKGNEIYNIVERKAYRKTIITLDHSLLVKRVSGETVNDMLYSLGEAFTQLKRKYPILFVILSQLNRGIDNPERCVPGKYGNYVLESDFFGADALLQHADMLVGINKPSKQLIDEYGPNRYFIPPNSNILAMHFLKLRNGEPRLSFFEADFGKMQIREAPTPISRKIVTKK